MTDYEEMTDHDKLKKINEFADKLFLFLSNEKVSLDFAANALSATLVLLLLTADDPIDLAQKLTGDIQRHVKLSLERQSTSH